MRKIRLVCLIGTLFLLSGCTIDYNVYINETQAIEEIIVNDYNVQTLPTPAYIDEQGSSETSDLIEGVEYYNISFQNANTYINYDFPLSEYDRSTAVNTCLSSFRVRSEGDGIYSINTSGHNSCMDVYTLIDDINITMEFDEMIYQVVSSNADSSNGNTLVWHVTRDNYNNKSVQVTYELIEYEDDPEEDPGEEDPIEDEPNTGNNYLLLVGAMGILVLAILAVVFIKIRKR